MTKHIIAPYMVRDFTTEEWNSGSHFKKKTRLVWLKEADLFTESDVADLQDTHLVLLYEVHSVRS